MNKNVKFWITPNSNPQYSKNKDRVFEHGVKYPVLDIDFQSGRMLVVISDGLMKYTTSDAFVVADGIRPMPIEEVTEVTEVREKEEFVKLTKVEYQALSKEEKEAYSIAKKEWENE